MAIRSPSTLSRGDGGIPFVGTDVLDGPKRRVRNGGGTDLVAGLEDAARRQVTARIPHQSESALQSRF